MGRFSTLNTALTGMNVAQANLYVTGHNMANTNIVGYTRQQVIQSTHFSQNIGRFAAGTMQLGLGSNVQSIRQIRDRFLDLAFRNVAPTVGFYNVMHNVGLTVQQTIGELEGENRLQTVIRDLKDSISELLMDMGGVETRGEFIGSAIVFVDKANDIFNNLRAEQNRLNGQIIEMTRRVNELIAEINHYSQLIRLNEVTGDNANDFRDRVNLALDELSGYIQIDYRIGPNFDVTIFSEGHQLLTGGHQQLLGFRYSSKNTNFVEVVLTNRDHVNPGEILDYDARAPLFFRYDGWHQVITPQMGNDGGALKALLAARGLRPMTWVDTPNGFPDMDPPVPGLIERFEIDRARIESVVGPPATTIITMADVAALGVPEWTVGQTVARALDLLDLQHHRDLWTVSNSVIAQTQIQLDHMVHRIVTTINNAFAPLIRGENPAGDEYYDGNPIYIKDPNFPFGQDASQRFMPVFVRQGHDNRWRPGHDGSHFDPDGWIVGENAWDSTTLFTIGNFIVNPELRAQAGYRYLALSESGDLEDMIILERLLTNWDRMEFFNLEGSRIIGTDVFYRRIITDLAVTIEQYREYAHSSAEELHQTDGWRMQMSGVALDEEMAAMLRFQHAFHAAARVFNYVDSMLDRLINGTGRVGL